METMNEVIRVSVWVLCLVPGLVWCMRAYGACHQPAMSCKKNRHNDDKIHTHVLWGRDKAFNVNICNNDVFIYVVNQR